MEATATISPDTTFDWNRVEKQQQLFTNNFTFKLAMLKMLPMGFLIGMKIKDLNNDTCTVTVPYKYLNKNPFGSTFWAVMGMAAEMTSGALSLQYLRALRGHSVAFILVEQDAQFYSKAVGITRFECASGPEIRDAILQTIATGEPVVVKCPVQAYNKQGEVIAEFSFSWSYKARSKR